MSDAPDGRSTAQRPFPAELAVGDPPWAGCRVSVGGRLLAAAHGAAVIALVWLVLPAAAGTSPSRAVTPTSIAGIGLGLQPAAYQDALRERPVRIRLPGNRSKLVFARSELSVTLDARSRGIQIETPAREYTTRGGVHPCGPLNLLVREFGSRLVVVRERTTRMVVAYRVGTLTFSTTMGKVGSIILSSAPVPAATAANSPHCGQGEEG
jgi:hypothetical protein